MHSTLCVSPDRSLTLSPDAAAILADYARFVREIWNLALASPDAVLDDALHILVARYHAFRHWREQGGRPHRLPAPAVSRRPCRVRSVRPLPLHPQSHRRRR